MTRRRPTPLECYFVMRRKTTLIEGRLEAYGNGFARIVKEAIERDEAGFGMAIHYAHLELEQLYKDLWTHIKQDRKWEKRKQCCP